MTFIDRLVEAINAKKSVLCVGLDPQIPLFPEHLRKLEPYEAITTFNKGVINAVAQHAVAVKPQMAFYERFGSQGVRAFEESVRYAKEKRLLVVEDAKRGDGGDTAIAYAEGHIGKDSFAPIDALTVQPGIGFACLDPFVDVVKRDGNGIFVVTKSSFSPNSFVENLIVEGGDKVWEEIAKVVNQLGQGAEGKYGYTNVGVVMGATYPEDATRMRELVPKSFMLVPGYGAQGGGADGAVLGVDENGLGVLVNSSRDMTYAYSKGPFACDGKSFANASGLAAEFAKNDLNSALERRMAA